MIGHTISYLEYEVDNTYSITVPRAEAMEGPVPDRNAPMMRHVKTVPTSTELMGNSADSMYATPELQKVTARQTR